MPLGLEPAHLPLILLLPVLLVGTAFFNGCETAFFSLRPHEKTALRERAARDRAARLTLDMLAQPQALLVSLLLVNMTVSTLYFIISSVLLMEIDVSRVGAAGIVAGSLVVVLVVIFVGELGPKLLADRKHLAWIAFAAVPLHLIHRSLTPVRVPLIRWAIEPLGRLIVPEERKRSESGRLQPDEIESFLAAATRQGTITRDEEELLGDLAELRRRKVRDIMLPRVQMPALPLDTQRAALVALAPSLPAPFVPIYQDAPDNVLGVLDVNAFLLHPGASLRRFMHAPVFIPEIATLDHLLAHFRRTADNVAVVVDEYGQTAGLVTLDDAMRFLIAHPGAKSPGLFAEPSERVFFVGLGRWRVDGALRVHEFADLFGVDLGSTWSATLAGYVNERLGRLATVGDAVEFPGGRFVVAAMDGPVVQTLDVETSAE